MYKIDFTKYCSQLLGLEDVRVFMFSGVSYYVTLSAHSFSVFCRAYNKLFFFWVVSRAYNNLTLRAMHDIGPTILKFEPNTWFACVLKGKVLLAKFRSFAV